MREAELQSSYDAAQEQANLIIQEASKPPPHAASANDGVRFHGTRYEQAKSLNATQGPETQPSRPLPPELAGAARCHALLVFSPASATVPCRTAGRPRCRGGCCQAERAKMVRTDSVRAQHDLVSPTRRASRACTARSANMPCGARAQRRVCAAAGRGQHAGAAAGYDAARTAEARAAVLSDWPGAAAGLHPWRTLGVARLASARLRPAVVFCLASRPRLSHVACHAARLVK